MPELFGTSYVLPAIIVVVLLAALVLALLVNRRRKAAQPTAKLKKVPATPSASSRADTEPELAPAAANTPADGIAWDATAQETWGGEFEEPPAAEETPALPAGDTSSNGAPGEDTRKSSPPAQPTVASPRALPTLTPLPQRPASNPILPVVLTMLEGWGDVSDEDLERLGVFRPEKLIDTLDTLQLPKDLEGNDDVRYRLEQMSLYATQLQNEAEATDAATLETEEEVAHAAVQAAAEADAVPAADGEWSKADQGKWSGADHVVSGQDASPSITPLAAGAGLSGAAFYGAAEAADADEPAEAPRTWRSTAAESEAQSAEEAPPAIPGPAVPPPSALPWTEETEASDRSDRPEKPGLDTYSGGTAGHNTSGATSGPSSAGVVAAAAGAAAMGRHEDGAATGDSSSTGDDLDDTIETVPKPKRALGDFVRTADDLLALPPDERAEMTTFLQPAELAQVLRRTDDPELKKAVIDTLENIGKPSSLDVLRECMEDDNEEVRMRAQQAADRIMRL